jgi:hypothetical protein
MIMAISAKDWDWVTIRVWGTVAAFTLFLSYTGHAEAEPTLLTWTAPTTDEAGVDLPTGILKYRVYGRVAGNNGRFQRHTQEYYGLEADLSWAPKGCYDIYLTAVRTDSDQESAHSNEIVACFGLVCGEEGVDGTVGACEGDAPPEDEAPGPTPETQLLAPSAPLDASMGYSL